VLGIRLLLIVTMASILVWFLRSRDTASVRAGKKLLLAAIVVTAIVSVLRPGLVDSAAALLGVGRGADLLLYLLTVAFLFVSLNGYLKFKEMEHRIGILARELALSDEDLDDPPSKS
jgi:hypothetical protein